MFYSFPTSDDYTFGYRAHQSYLSGDGFWTGVFASCSRYYNEWQGFFTCNFIASSQPYTISENLYFVSNLLFFSVFVFSLFLFAKAMLIDIIKVRIRDYILVTVPIVGYIIQFLPSAAEGIYWMDGSLAMLITGLVFILILVIIKYSIAGSKRYKFFLFALSIVLSVVCSGGIIMDYVTFLLLYIFSIVYCAKKRHNMILILTINFAVLTTGFLFSALAPGNNVRKATMQGFSVIKSIMYAIYSSFQYFGTWFTVSFMIVLLFSSIVLWNTLKNSKYNFKNPLLVLVLCYAVYSGRMSVQLYAGGYLGSPRQMNQYFIGFVCCTSIAWLYFIGWLSKKQSTKMIIINKDRMSAVLCLLSMIIFLAGGLSYGFKNLNSISTSLSLIRGETQQYCQEMSDRLAIYKDESVKTVTVKPLTNYPVFFLHETHSTSSSYWVNTAIATYYDKDSVVLLDENKKGK